MEKIDFKKHLIYFLILLIPSFSFADENILGKVKQINYGKKLAAIELVNGSALAVGENVVITSADSKQCDLKIEEFIPSKNVAILNTSTCSFGNEIKVGQNIEKSLLGNKDFTNAPKEVSKRESEVSKTAQAEGNERSWKTGVGISHGSNSTLKFDKITVANSATTMSGDLDYSNVFSAELDIRNMKSNSWGFISGLTLDGERKLTGGSITGAGVTLTTTATDPSKISTTVLYANAAYQWENFYLPFGFNYSFVKYTPPTSFQGTFDASGGLGAQLGMGYYVSSHFVSELFSRVVAVKLKSTTASGLAVNFGDGFLSSIQLTAKYFF